MSFLCIFFQPFNFLDSLLLFHLLVILSLYSDLNFSRRVEARYATWKGGNHICGSFALHGNSFSSFELSMHSNESSFVDILMHGYHMSFSLDFIPRLAAKWL